MYYMEICGYGTTSEPDSAPSLFSSLLFFLDKNLSVKLIISSSEKESYCMSIAAIIFDLLLNPLVPKETISKLKVQGYNYPEFPLNVKEQKYGRLGRGLVFDHEIARA